MIEYNRSQTKLLFEIGLLSQKNVLKDYKSRLYQKDGDKEYYDKYFKKYVFCIKKNKHGKRNI